MRAIVLKEIPKKYLRLNGFMQKKGEIQNSGFYVANFHWILRLYFANYLTVNPILHERQLYLHGNQFLMIIVMTSEPEKWPPIVTH